MSHEAQTLEPQAIRKGEGEARWWFGALAEIKATAADTGGQRFVNLDTGNWDGRIPRGVPDSRQRAELEDYA